MAAGAVIYGQWEDMTAATEPIISHQQMTLAASHLVHTWRRCSQSADFWAQYVSLFAAPLQFKGEAGVEALESTISYLLNELFENCAKFSQAPLDTIQYNSWIFRDGVTFQIRNHIQPSQRATFVKRIKELLNGNPDGRYDQKLQENAESDGSSSGLGYLTLMKDYPIRFSFRFTPITEMTIAVDVQAHVDLKEL